MDPRLKRYIGKLAGIFVSIEVPAVLLFVSLSQRPYIWVPYSLDPSPFIELLARATAYVFPIFFIPLAIIRIARKHKSLKAEQETNPQPQSSQSG